MNTLLRGVVLLIISFALPAVADWQFSNGPVPNAFLQSGNKTLELQCDRMRFAPAGYEDSEAIVNKQALSIRFMKNGSTEVGAFQAGKDNANMVIVDNYPVEIVFNEPSDYVFVLDQIAANAVLNLSMVEQDISYGIFDLKGSSAAIKALRSVCDNPEPVAGGVPEAPEGVVYCGGGQIKRQIEYRILDKADGQWDAVVTVNGKSLRAMTAYSFFGNARPPKGFVVALLGEDRSEFLVFNEGHKHWLEFGDYQYDQCN